MSEYSGAFQAGVVPTEDGIKILDLSKEIIDRYNEMLSCYQPGSIPEKRVHFAGNTTICQYFSVYLTKVIQNVSDPGIYYLSLSGPQESAAHAAGRR